jgi:hypothetical protein
LPCLRALFVVPCVPTPCLAQAALKKLSCDQLYSLSGGCLVFLPGTDSCGRSRIFVRSPHADTPCLASWHLPLPCLLAPCLSWPCLASWCLAMPCLPWVPNLRTCLVLRLGAHLADVPCVALMQANLGEAVLERSTSKPKFVLIHPPAHLLA